MAKLVGPTGVARGRLGIVTLGVESRLRPVEVDADDGIERVATDRERTSEDLLGATEVSAVDERVAEQELEANALELVVPALGSVEAALEDRDRGLELSHHRVRPTEGVGQVRMRILVASVEL